MFLKDEKNINCSKCKKQFKDIFEAEKHARECQKIKYRLCPRCGSYAVIWHLDGKACLFCGWSPPPTS